MTDIVAPLTLPPRSMSPGSPGVLAVQKFEGLSLEPLNRDVVELGDEDGDTEAVTKEEEWITKRKTELTTTRQIETRVKRQVVLEDGKVIGDSGPIVSTNTTEDTEKQETESTERRNLGDPDVVDSPKAIDHNDGPDNDKLIITNTTSGISVKMPEKVTQPVAPASSGKIVHTLVARPDGLVREVNEKRVVSREEIKERLETEDVRHLGDFSDEAFVTAVNSGVENLEEVLYSPEHQKQLVPVGPRVVHQSTKTHKTVDTEDTEKKHLAQPDGTLVTEKKKTTEHQEIFDQDLPPDDGKHSIGSGEKVLKHTESSQKYFKQRDEQNVEYVADGKVIAKEMRYAAETEQMERDGPEGPHDWDSLSDRIRKARRSQKTLLQQQREAALLADRKDALTKRPLDFDREEETRKGETIKWLESHFGSDSPASSQDGSRDDEHGVEIEPTKKTFFNVTIKSNQTSASPITPSPTTPPIIKPLVNGKSLNGIHSNGAIPPPKGIVSDRDRELSTARTKYFQGISNWSDRKEATSNHFASKAFRDELKGTLEKGRLKHVASREDLHFIKSNKDEYVSKEDILHQKSLRQYKNGAGDFGSRSDLRYRKDSREDSDDSKTIRTQKEDLGYLSGSRTDMRYRRDSKDELNGNPTENARKPNSYLKREDSGYVKDSREDVRSSLLRDVEDEREKYKNSLIQRDDSAYVSSSTYFTDSRSPKTPQMRTPDSGIRSPSPDVYDTDNTIRPTVPQRKRAIEKKLRQQNSYSPPSPPLHISREEPPPDYSPPPRSRSISPAGNMMNRTANGIQKKTNQRTRFVSESSLISHSNLNSSKNGNYRPAVSTQTIQTQTSPPPKQSSKVGQVIGNSIRKLVGKIRSASAERKMKMKTKNNNSSNNNRNRSPSPSNKRMTPPDINGSTYQQYNVIDSHIGGQVHPVPQHIYPQQQHQITSTMGNRESSVVSSSTTAGRRERERDRNRRGSSDLDMMGCPKQRYYLGEDPYGGSIFGKENKYDGGRPSHLQLQQQHRSKRHGSSGGNGSGGVGSGDDREPYVQKSVNASTLGRFTKSINRLGSTPNLDHDYRSAQTLPRKLDHPNHHSSTINVSIVNTVKPTSTGQPLQNTGPAKPARTYKQLSRSKSFNVHAMNGTNDPSPIYLEKLTRNNYSSSMYKSNPHLHESGPQLKSPSIVNLISRSQRDLTRIDEDRKYSNYLNEKKYVSNNNIINYTNENYDRRNTPDPYKHIEDEIIPTHNGYQSHKSQPLRNRERESSSLGSKSPIEINKDTASIVRRESSSTEDYAETYKITTKSEDPKRPSVTNTIQSFTKKTVPLKDGRGFETIQSSERKSVTTSRYRGEPYSNFKYIEDHKRRGSPAGGGPVVIEVRSGSRK